MKFVHAADLHIDSPLVGLERYEGAPVEQIRQATRRAMANLVELCVEESVQLLILAGDLFDGDWRDYSTGLFFVGQMQRLRQAGVDVVIARGNHDAASQISRQLTLPDNVREFGTEAPESFFYEEAGLCLHGQSYGQRAEFSDLAATYPDAVAGYLNIGVLHTCMTGRPGHEPYAPSKLETLRSKGYDYWALGHIHQREVLERSPWVVFPGNLQGRHIKETGPKGATLVDYADGVIETVQPRVLDVVRFVHLKVGAEEAPTPDDVVDEVFEVLQQAKSEAERRVLVARIDVTGSTQGHAGLHQDPERWEAEIRARATELPDVWIEKVRFRTRHRTSVEAWQQRGDALGQVVRTLQQLRQERDLRQQWLTAFDDLKLKLPPEVRQGVGAVNLDDPESIVELVDDVEELLVNEMFDEVDA